MTRPVKVVYIQDDYGTKAFIGDTVKLNMLVPTSWGDSGVITEIRGDCVVLDNCKCNPHVGIKSIKVYKRGMNNR